MDSYRCIGDDSDICRFQQTSQTSLDVNELVFFSICGKVIIGMCQTIVIYLTSCNNVTCIFYILIVCFFFHGNYFKSSSILSFKVSNVQCSSVLSLK